MNIRHYFFRIAQSIRCTALLGLMIGGLCTASAADTGTVAAGFIPTPRLTLNDCTRIALAQSPLLKATAQDQAISREAVGEARASYYPQLGIHGGVSRWQNHAFLPSGISSPNGSSTIGPTEDWNAGGFARYPLYDGGRRRATLDMAKAGESASVEDGNAMRLNVLFDVHQSFYHLANAHELQTVAVKNQANVESHFTDAKNRQAAGDTTEADVLRAQVEVDNAQAELIRADTRIHTAQGDLNVVMGMPAEDPIDIIFENTGIPCPTNVNVAEVMAQAIAARPEIKALQSAQELAQYRVRATQADFGPQVFAEGGYGWRDDSVALDDEAWSIGVTVEWTLFEGFAKRHALVRTRAEAAKTEALLEQATLAVRRDVWAATARVQEAAALVNATASQVQHATESLRLMAVRYKTGAVSMTDLLDVQTALTAAEVRHVQALWGCRLAQSALQRATGALTGEP